MTKIFDLKLGQLPILVSMPHNGIAIPHDIQERMHPYALRVIDTDWYLDKLYGFAQDLGCSIIKPHYSRYVIDLNRPQNNESLYPGSDTTELCPTSQFDKRPIYLSGEEPNEAEIKQRIDKYWRPYHDCLEDTLNQLLIQHGYVLLFEAHSIKSEVPRFFDGQLPHFNFGNLNGSTSSVEINQLLEHWQPGSYSKVVNERFKGGYITRHYGQPGDNIDSLQLELSQATYLDEFTLGYDEEKAGEVIPVLKNLFSKLVDISLDKAGQPRI